VNAALGLLGDPARWPDIGCASGRFTPVRRGGLLGQTFEIEVVADAAPRAPIATRGYVTCTTALTAQDGDALTIAGDGWASATRAAPAATRRPCCPTPPSCWR
jgi:hypothetical protein